MNNEIRPVELQRIERGIALLDSVEPKWFKKINPRDFNLNDGDQCVLGQVYQNYFNGLRELAAKAIDAPLHTLKFDVEPVRTVVVSGRLKGKYYGFETNGNASYERMGQAWLAVVRQRERREKRQRAAKRG